MRRTLPFLLLSLLLLVPAAPAAACSRSDTTYLDAFLDTDCLELPLTNTTLDAFGGLRLTTNGAPSTTSWQTDTHFATGVTHQSTVFGPVDVSTLAVEGTGDAAQLRLPATTFPLEHDGASPILPPPASPAADSDNVDDPAVVKVGAQWVMYYSGAGEDGRGPSILRATSPDGRVWTRTGVVLEGTADTWDEHGVFGAEVLYDAADAATPYRMWYSGRGDVFGAIGYATSADGITWTKHAGPVLDHGPAGSADSFAAADPSVLRDGDTWKMWYTGDDSSRKRIAYATSPDGVTWTKGGKVISPEDDGVSANLAFGAFAPTVWKDGAQFKMLLTGRKLVAGDQFQTKILNASSPDGLDWTGPSPAINPSGNAAGFDYSNLNSPEVVIDGTTVMTWYSGNTIDANGNFHTRIGLAVGPNFVKFGGAQSGGSVLDVAAGGTAFDGRQTSGLSVIAPTGALAAEKYVGAYWGTRGSDFEPRIGLAKSPDGSTWTKSVGSATGGSQLDDSSGNSFDADGQRDPVLLDDGANTRMYFTGIDGTESSIGYATAAVTAGQLGAFSNPPQAAMLSGDGSGFDSEGVAHPSVVKSGATYVLFYTGTDASGNTAIGRATSTVPDFATNARGAGAVLQPGTAGSFDADGVKDPVVAVVGAEWRMLYTGVEIIEAALEDRRIERVGYATSADGITWTKQGVLINPSQVPHSYDERGANPTGFFVSGADIQVWTSGIDETGRTRGGHWLPAELGVTRLPVGWATYQLGGPSTSVLDFRSLASTQTGAVEIWASFLQPYSSTDVAKQFWSDYFPLTANPATLNFLLTVRGMRWQARLSDPAADSALDKVDVVHAPVSFSPSGSATTTAITPPEGKQIQSWTSVTTESESFSPSGGTGGAGTVTVLSGVTGTELASGALGSVISLASVKPAEHPSLKVRLNLASTDGSGSPLVTLLKVLYSQEPFQPPPPPPPGLTLAAAPTVVVFGQPVALTGTLARPSGPVAGAAVKLFANNAPIAEAVTTPAGTFNAGDVPQANTTYRASFPGAVADATAAVQVKHLVTLKVRRRGTRGTFTGAVGPAHPGIPVVVQRKSGTSWVSFATFKTGATSVFTGTKKLKPRTKYRFRAVTASDVDHLGGQSAEVLVERQKVSLKISLSGRKATFTGTVKPLQKSGPVIIQALKGTRWVTLVKTKLTRRSTFKVAKRMSKGSYRIRARRPTNRYYFYGQSAVKSLRVR